MTTSWLLLLVNIAATWCCSTVHVSTPDGDTVIGRTMELDNPGSEMTFGGLRLGVDPSDPDTDDLPYNVSVHRQDELVGKLSLAVCNSCKPFKTTIGYVSVDLVAHVPASVLTPGTSLTVAITTDGMNEKGLTVSTQVFHQSVLYMQPSAPEASGTTNVCFAAFADWVLGTFDSVKSLRKALKHTKIVGPKQGLVENPDLAVYAGLHWSIDDASEHIVLEVLDGVIKMHNNTVGVVTNQPDFTWHLRNLNNFVNLRSDWPRNLEIQVQTDSEGSEFQPEVGLVPDVSKAGHGFNLLGLPGDYSPPSRFVRLFYLRQYAVLRFPPKERKGKAKYTDSIALVTGLLNNVWINKGTVPDPPPIKEGTPPGFGEFTQYTVVKIPEARLFFYKDYVGTQWRKVRLGALIKKGVFSSKEGAPPDPVPLVEGTVSIKDVTALFTASGSSTCEPDDDDDASSCES